MNGVGGLNDRTGSSAMTLTKRRTSRRSMTRLARSSSLSLTLPRAGSLQQNSAFLCNLRRAQSSIPALGEVAINVNFGNDLKNFNIEKVGVPSDAGHHGKSNSTKALALSGHGDVDRELDCYQSESGSCNSSITDLFDVLDEPRRVSKEMLRSVSITLQWFEGRCAVPIPHELELHTCRADTMDGTSHTTSEKPIQLLLQEQNKEQQRQDDGSARSNVYVAHGGMETAESPIGSQESARFAYIHEYKTGRCLASHVELKAAMDTLPHWTMQMPGNCCLRYRHDISGDVGTLPWPDLEAGGMDEIEDFVSMVNRIEDRLIFFPCFRRMKSVQMVWSHKSILLSL